MTPLIEPDCKQSSGLRGRPNRRYNTPETSRNLDLLRSMAVLLVVVFHLTKFFNWQFDELHVMDFGLLGVMLFFVHTTLVLMFSLERQRTDANAQLFLPFMVRRCFRIYPLAVLAVTFVYLFHIPSDLQFGRFDLLHQTGRNLVANLLLIQNVSRQKANPGPLWSLPLELQMYLVLPILFAVVSRWKSSWGVILFWWSSVALWFAVGLSTGLLPLSEGDIRSPVEALLKFTRFVPCFLPGLVAYKLWRRPRLLPGFLWPAFLLLCCGVFVVFSGSQPIEAGWFICFSIGLGVCLFRELPAGFLTRLAKLIARYSYGIYLFHYFAIWLGFAAGKHLNVGLQITIFIATLTFLPAILYHGVEAPMIALGVRVSERFKAPLFPTWKTLVAGFVSRASLVIAILLIIVPGTTTRAQGLPATSPRSLNQVETTQQFNQRLEESRKMLAGALPDSTGNESRIGPDDLLEITVFEAPEMNRTLRVSANGEISMQLLGPVKAAGLTTQELESVLVQMLGRTYMKDPHVGVFVRELQSHPVSVVGAVKKPGVYQIPNSKTVIELLSMAEGLADDAGDTVLIMRGKGFGEPETAGWPDRAQENGEIVKVNLKNLLESADSTLNVSVHSGDIVKVARAGIVYVVGEVKKPGGFVLKSSVLQALALAEGLTRVSAKSQVRIIRTDQATDKRIEIPVDLGKILASKSPDPMLEPRDVVFVPDSSAKSAFYRGAEAVLSAATGVAIYRW